MLPNPVFTILPESAMATPNLTAVDMSKYGRMLVYTMLIVVVRSQSRFGKYQQAQLRPVAVDLLDIQRL